MKQNWKVAFMDAADRFAQESYATRLQVGAIVVKDNRIISIGINGMPSGWDNICEDKLYLNEFDNPFMGTKERQEEYPFEDEYGFFRLKSKPEVLHAETNAIAKLAKGREAAEGSAIFVTHSPCLDCAKSIYQAGITEVYYRNAYRCNDGLDFLVKCGILVEQIK